jgi:hypothetical protein
MDEPVLSSQTAAAGADPAAPLEAIVLEEPPVRVPRAQPAPAGSPAARPIVREKTYVVPKRFGVSAILAMMTAMGFLFGFLRFLEAPPVVFLFLGTMVLVIAIVQMFCGQVPRLASIAAGAALSPLFVTIGFAYSEERYLGEVICVVLGSIFWGALGGYLTGTCAAGIFLVMDKIDPYLPGGRSRAASHANPPAGPQLGTKR